MPSATLVIFLSPASIPSLVIDGPSVITTPSLFTDVNGLPAASLIVRPPPFTTVLPSVPLLKVAEFRPLRSFARRSINVSVPSATTPMLSSLDSFAAAVIPPLTLTWLLSFFLITVPVSPPYNMPSSIVATWCSPVLSVYTIRVIPSTPSTPFSPLTPLAASS